MINDVNYVKSQFQSWYRANNWLIHIYPFKLSELEHKLKGVQSPNFEEKTGFSQITESMRRSKIIDRINMLEQERRHNESICDICEALLERVRPQYHDVFEYMYKYNSTVAYVAYKTGYSERRIYEIINEESERLSRE